VETVRVIFVGAEEFYETGAKIVTALGISHELIKFKHPEEFSAYLRHKVFNAYTVGVVVCDLSIAKNRTLSLYDEYLDTYSDGFLKFIFIDDKLTATEISDLIKSGITAVLSKNCSEKKLNESIKVGINESISKRSAVVKNITAVARFGNLSNKEIAILSLMLNGYTNREIAKKLGNSSRTIEIHRASIFDKMNVKNAIELALLLND
jgi:DNA-binding NarL/FixJ family response regulator